MDQDADKPDEQVEKLTEYPEFLVLGDDLDDEDAAKPDERQAGISVNEADEVVLFLDALAAEFVAEPCDDLLGLDDDVDEAVRFSGNVLVDDGEDEEGSSQLAMILSSEEVDGCWTGYEIPPWPKDIVAVETPSLIQCIARLFFGGFR